MKAKMILQEKLDAEILVVKSNIKRHDDFVLTDCSEAIQKADIVAYLVAHDEFRQEALRI